MDKHLKYDDDTLLNKYYLSKDQYWLGILLQRYTLLLLGVCMKYLKNEHDAQDAVQQVFIKVLRELGKNKVTYFKSWLYTVARNHCLMQLRTRNNLIIEELDFGNVTLTEENHHSEKKLEKEILYEYMETAIKQLNEEQQTCISLFYLNDKTYNEITQITGYNNTQVKSYIQNGKRNLKILILKMKEENG